jgi:prepilin-type N-terminal cleavage/methylation domain-containing protein
MKRGTPLRTAGFTLVEILVTLLVLSIGLASVLSLVFGSTRQAMLSTDRNLASVLVPEAVADIERMHLITPVMATRIDDAGHQTDYVGELVDTVDIMNGPYKWVPLSDSTSAQFSQFAVDRGVLGSADEAPTVQSLLTWPLSATPRYYAGMPANNVEAPGMAYRALYRLEGHPDWKARGEASPYAGLYILTLTIYRDLNPNVHPQKNNKRYEQVSDPMVVYLRDKKVRR